MAPILTTGAGCFLTIAGGGGASAAALFGANSGASGTAAPWTASTPTFSNGVAVVGAITSRGGSFPDITGVTINTVPATKIGAGFTVASDFSISMWYATVTAGAGTVVIATGGGTISQTAVCGWMITGAVSGTPTTPTGLTTDNATSPHSDPQSLGSLTVNSAGVGVVFIAGSFHSGTNELPTSWTNATRDLVTESADAAGNGYTIAGAHLPSAGTFTVTASGAAGAGWQYNGMIGAAWA